MVQQPTRDAQVVLIRGDVRDGEHLGLESTRGVVANLDLKVERRHTRERDGDYLVLVVLRLA